MYPTPSTAAICGTDDRFDSIYAAWYAPESRYGEPPPGAVADAPTADDRRDWAAMTADEPSAAELAEWESVAWEEYDAARDFEEMELAEVGFRAGYDD